MKIESLNLRTAADVQGKGKADAKNCFMKAAEGTNTTEEGAKFQAFEALVPVTVCAAAASDTDA